MLANLIPPQVKIGIAAAIIVALAVMGWRLHAAVEKNGALAAQAEHMQAQLTAAAMAANEAAKQARQDRQADAAALAEARRLAEVRRQQAATLSAQLTEARANADLSDCLDMRLPDSVRLP